MVDSANLPRPHRRSSQNHRRLHQMTSTAPATGTSRMRWRRREWTRVEITPQTGHPGGEVDSTSTRRATPGTSSASITR